MQMAKKYNLYVIEDNAQSIGAVYTFADGTKKQAGTMGDIGTLSFFPTKNLGCYGDGGAILTNNELLAQKLKMLASHGQSQKYRHELIGCNSRLDTLQAAILNVKLAHLQQFIAARQHAAQQYNERLQHIDWLETPDCIPNSTHVYHQYTLKINNGKRDELQQYLKEKGIPTMIYYPLPLQKQTAYLYLAYAGSDLSTSVELANSVLSLPMHTELEDEQIAYIVEQIINYEL
jgi:dTDP-4-amino-4,6-dideoxygalactose transaminase